MLNNQDRNLCETNISYEYAEEASLIGLFEIVFQLNFISLCSVFQKLESFSLHYS